MFFQGYSDLKRRVAEDHPEWDLAGYSGVDSDYWDVEASEAGVPTPAEEGAGSVDASDAARGQEGPDVPAQTGAEEIVQIVDDEPAA